jgi:hypothetical protein
MGALGILKEVLGLENINVEKFGGTTDPRLTKPREPGKGLPARKTLKDYETFEAYRGGGGGKTRDEWTEWKKVK